MVKKDIKIRNEIALQARNVALFVQTASRFLSKIFVQKDNAKVNAKSILGIVSLGVSKDSCITIVANGLDEEKAIGELINLINN